MPIISSLALSCVWLNNFYSILQNCYYNMGLQVIAKRLLESKQNTPHLYLSTGAWILALHIRIKNSIHPLLMYLTFFFFFGYQMSYWILFFHLEKILKVWDLNYYLV